MQLIATWSNALGWPLLAVALMIWARERALRHRAAAPVAALDASDSAQAAAGSDIRPEWFTFVRRANGIAMVCVVASILGSSASWVTLMQASRAWGLPASVIPWLVWGWLFAPAFTIQLALPLLAHDVARRLGTTELTWSDVRTQVLWSLLAFASLTLALVHAVAAATLGHWASAATALVGGFALFIWANLQLRRALGFTPHAVTQGELRDRLFALAASAGVSLQQLYVLPMKRMRMANAFAVQNRVVMITDVLLEQLSRAEVDAIMAHEIGHLRHRHPEKLTWARLLPIIPVTLALVLGGGNWLAAAVGMLIGTLALSALSRRFERTADREVLRLGADGEALITGLVKLARFGHIPVRWGRWAAWSLTHPSVEQRAEQMVRELGLPATRVAELLAPTPAPTDRYAAPHEALDHGALFSTPFKHAILMRNAWMLMLTSAIVPALIALIANALGAQWRWPAWLAAALLAPVACVAVINWLAVAPLRALRAGLADRLLRGSTNAASGEAVLVGLSPHGDARSYEGFANWDLGFVWEQDGLLHYRGDKASFALAPHTVMRTECVPGAPSWIATQSVRIQWRDTAGNEHALRLTPIESHTLAGITPRTTALHARLTQWTHSATATTTLESLPPTGEVTSVTPRQLVQPGFYLQMAVMGLVICAIVCMLLGVPFTPWRSMGYLEVFVSYCCAQVVLTLPLIRHREPQQPMTQTVAREARAA